MKSKLRTWAEEIWSCLVITVMAALFLFMVFALVVILVLTVAESMWFLLLIPLWPLDMFVLKKVLNYTKKKWGENND